MKFTEFLKKVDDTFMSKQPPKISAANRWRYGQTLMNVLWDVWPEPNYGQRQSTWQIDHEHGKSGSCGIFMANIEFLGDLDDF